MTAPNAAKTLNARLAYASVCTQTFEEEYFVDEERLLMSGADLGPLTVIWINWTRRALVVSPGSGCIPTINVELTAENRPA
jgi:hypothetical protein